MMLPAQKTPPRMRLSDLTVLVHGPAKIGKSTLCSNAPDALFLATEAGLNALEVYQIPIRSWADFLNACKEVAEGTHAFKTIVVDTLDNLFLMCQEHVCERHKIEHPSDLGYGKGFSLVNNEFYRVLNKLSLLPYGLFLISHSQEKATETRTGKRTRVVPALPEKARQAVLGMVDVILFCDVETAVDPEGKHPVEHRVLRTKPTEAYEAGDRTGRLPGVIELEYASFAEAFERAAPAAGASPDPSPPQAVPAAADEAPQAEASDGATEEQVGEFRSLAVALGIPADVTKERLAQYGVAEPEQLSRADMETILGRLRAAGQTKAPENAA